MSQLTPWDIYQYATQCPAWKGKYALMTAICLAESGGDTEAGEPGHTYNPCCVGLWQINCAAHGVSRVSMRNPMANLQEACKVFASQGLNAWESYTNGSYKAHVPAVEKAIKNAGVNEKVGEVGVFPESVVKKAEEVGSGLTSWTGELGKVLGFIDNKSGWVRIGKVVLGTGFVIIAAIEVSKGGGAEAATGAGKAAGSGAVKGAKRAAEITGILA